VIAVGAIILPTNDPAPREGPIAAQPPKMKYTTEIPPDVITADDGETPIGTLHVVDSAPTEATVQKVWGQLDFQNCLRTETT